MILLDTNVASALMQRHPDLSAVAWLDNQPAESVWTTSITVLEIRTGLELLEPGRRRQQLQQAFDELPANELAGRVQPFDQAAALAAGSIAANHHRAGRSVEVLDVQIAGIAAARKATLATRNSLVDPWRGLRAAALLAIFRFNRRQSNARWPALLPAAPERGRRQEARLDTIVWSRRGQAGSDEA